MKLKHYISIGTVFVALVAAVRCADSINKGSLNTNMGLTESHEPTLLDRKIYWGAETNGIKAGLSIEQDSIRSSTNATGHIPIRFTPLLYNDSTNNGNVTPTMLILDLPPLFESRYRLELTDEKGISVPKTSKGKAFGKTAPQPYRLIPNRVTGVIIDTGWRPARYILLPKQVRGLQPTLVLQDYFKITTSGKYHLHFEVFAFKPIDTDTNELIHFPPVNAEIEIKNP